MPKMVKSKWCCVKTNKEPVSIPYTPSLLTQILYLPEDTGFRVMIQAQRALSERGWMHIVQHFQGYDMIVDAMNRNKTPLMRFVHAGNRHLVRSMPILNLPVAEEDVKVPPVDLPVVSQVGFKSIEDFLQSPYDPSVDVLDVARMLIQDKWKLENLESLQRYDMLEAHRMLLQLENSVKRVGADRTKSLTPAFVLVDPLTLVIPLMLDNPSGLAVYREHIVQMEMWRMKKYYEELTRGVKEDVPEWSWPVMHDEKQLRYKVEKQRIVLKRHAKSEWVQMYHRVVNFVVKGFPEDSVVNKVTVNLPPTESMQEAIYSLGFLI